MKVEPTTNEKHHFHQFQPEHADSLWLLFQRRNSLRIVGINHDTLTNKVMRPYE